MQLQLFIDVCAEVSDREGDPAANGDVAGMAAVAILDIGAVEHVVDREIAADAVQLTGDGAFESRAAGRGQRAVELEHGREGGRRRVRIECDRRSRSRRRWPAWLPAR